MEKNRDIIIIGHKDRTHVSYSVKIILIDFQLQDHSTTKAGDKKKLSRQDDLS